MLKALGTWNTDFANHPPMILVGTGDSRQWSRYYGFTDPEVLLAGWMSWRMRMARSITPIWIIMGRGTAMKPVLALLGLLLVGGIGWAHEGHHHDEATSPPVDASAAQDVAIADARNWFTDTVLLDQDGRSLRFYSDVLQGRVVLPHDLHQLQRCLPADYPASAGGARGHG